MLNGKLDDTDLRILNNLQRDGRIDVAKLLQLVHKTPSLVAERFRRLRETGYFKKIVAVPDREKAGKPVLVVTHVKLQQQTTAQLEAFEVCVRDLTEVQFCLHISRGWNFILHVTAETPQAYFTFLMEKICNLPNVAHVESCPFVL